MVVAKRLNGSSPTEFDSSELEGYPELAEVEKNTKVTENLEGEEELVEEIEEFATAAGVEEVDHIS